MNGNLPKPAKGRTSNRERQQAWAMAKRDAGFVPCTVWVRPGQVADIRRAAELLAADSALTIGRLTDTRTGRLRSLKAQPAVVATPPDA